MSDDEGYEENMTAEQRETIRKLRKTVRVPSQTDLNIEVAVSDPEKAELKAENEDLKNKLSLIAQRRFNAKKKSLNAPDSIRTPEDLKDWEENRGNIDPTQRGSSGTLSLAGQTTDFGSGTAFESQTEMLAELQRRAHSGKTMAIREESSKILAFLWEKYLRGKKGKARHEAFEEMKDEGEGLIKKFQREYRKRKGIE